MLEPGTPAATILSPGATRSRPRPAHCPPCRAEYDATESSVLLSVPLVSVAPTAMTHGLDAGLESPPPFEPSLPPAATTTMPRCQAISAAHDTGSFCQLCGLRVPYDSLRSFVLRPPAFLFFTTQAIAAMTCETSTAPSWSATFT